MEGFRRVCGFEWGSKIRTESLMPYLPVPLYQGGGYESGFCMLELVRMLHTSLDRHDIHAVPAAWLPQDDDFNYVAFCNYRQTCKVFCFSSNYSSANAGVIPEA